MRPPDRCSIPSALQASRLCNIVGVLYALRLPTATTSSKPLGKGGHVAASAPIAVNRLTVSVGKTAAAASSACGVQSIPDRAIHSPCRPAGGAETGNTVPNAANLELASQIGTAFGFSRTA